MVIVFETRMRLLDLRFFFVFVVFVTGPSAMQHNNGGMSVRTFEGIEGILEVECNAEKLGLVDVLTISLFRISPHGSSSSSTYSSSTERKSLLAFVSPQMSQCTTAEQFSSCEIQRGSSRSTRLKTLVLDLKLGESRVFMCNLTSLDSQKQVKAIQWSMLVSRNRMEVRSFQGVPDVQEVTCSGEFFPPETEVILMSLYTLTDKEEEVAFVRLSTGSCRTYGGFSSCLLDKAGRSRLTKLKTLVMNLSEGESRLYGCRMTVVKDSRTVEVVSKSIVARKFRLRTDTFFNRPDILEVQCSGNNLPSNVDLLSMSLFELHADPSTGRQTASMLGSVNFGANKCLASSSFSACSVDRRNSRRTSLRAIALELREGEVRHYGCNVTSFQSGGKTNVLTWTTSARAQRLSVRVFENIPHVLEVTCTGQSLASNLDLLTLVLYTRPGQETQAYVNLRKHKCTTSANFASCTVNERDSRRSSLSVLVMDLPEGETRRFGCNAGYEVDGWLNEQTWTLDVRQNRLSTSEFQNLPDVLQVTCSGESMESSWILLNIRLYTPSHEASHAIAYVSVVQEKCTTSSSFSSCVLDPYDRRKTRLVTLITDLKVGESRSYGCAIGYETDGFTKTLTWSTVLHRNRMCVQGREEREMGELVIWGG